MMQTNVRDEIVSDMKKRFKNESAQWAYYPLDDNEEELCLYLMQLNQILKKSILRGDGQKTFNFKSGSKEGILFQSSLGLFALGHKDAIYDILPHLCPDYNGAINAARIACVMLPLPANFYKQEQKFEKLKGWLEANFNQLEWDDSKKSYYVNTL